MTPTITRHLCLDSDHRTACWRSWLGWSWSRGRPTPDHDRRMLWVSGCFALATTRPASLLHSIVFCQGWMVPDIDSYRETSIIVLEKACPPLALGTQTTAASHLAVPLP